MTAVYIDVIINCQPTKKEYMKPTHTKKHVVRLDDFTGDVLNEACKKLEQGKTETIRNMILDKFEIIAKEIKELSK